METNKLEIAVGKTYVTRDGRRTVDIVSELRADRDPGLNGERFVGVMYSTHDGGLLGAETWCADGTYNPCADRLHNLDLVAEHVPPFEAFVVIATRKNGEQACITTGTTDLDDAQRALEGHLRNPFPGTHYRIAKLTEVKP